MGNIQDIGRKFKGVLETVLREDAVFYGALIVLVSVASFGFGRLSAPPLPMSQGADIVLSHTLVPEARAATSTPAAGQERYVGSKHSTKYHLTTCPGAAQISDENKVWFASKAEAEAAGYVPAGNCEM